MLHFFFAFLCFLMMILLCKMTPKYSAELLSSVLKYKEAVICLAEEICVLDELYSGLSYSAIGCVFSANEPTIYIK